MKEKVAVVTVSGKAYYLLVEELKERKVEFVSLKPGEQVPPDVDVVITTPQERPLVKHLMVAVLGEDDDPTLVVDEALRLSRGKSVYEKVLIGLDPGKVLGIALLVDGELVDTRICQTPKHALDTIAKIIQRFPANSKIVRVGSGVMPYAQELVKGLDKILPPDVTIELVPESGTSQVTPKEAKRSGGKDAASAARIAERSGYAVDRHPKSLQRKRKKSKP